MLIITKPQVSHSEHYVCNHHRENPYDRSYPGCTCSSSYWSHDFDKPCDKCDGKQRNNAKNRFKITDFFGSNISQAIDILGKL